MHPGAIAATRPQAIAIICGTRRVSYAALDAASRRLALLARERGLERGEVLAILAGNTPEFLAAAWAAQRSGLYALPIGTRLTAPEVAYILADSGARLLLCDRERQSVALAALEFASGAATGAASGAATGMTDSRGMDTGPAMQVLDAVPALFDEDGAPLDVDPVEGGDMLYTSGTTGRPKGVRRPLPLTPLGSELARAQRLQSLFHMDGDSVFLSPAPLYHAAPLRFSMALLRLGGTLVLLPRFDPVAALDALQMHAVTHSQWVPTMFSRLLALDEQRRGALHAPAHRVAIHAGAPCPAAVKRRMIAWWGPILHEYYSGTESIGFTHLDSHEWLRHPGSVGRPWNCAVHILDDTGEELPPGSVGTVYFSGRGTPAYHGAPEKTAAALSPQGYATMGDLGYVDEEGYLFLTDRRAFTIISGGVNVYPREIEDALHADGRVAAAAVFGVTDEDLGEAVTAVVQLAPAVPPNLETARALREALSRCLARYKLPRRIAFHPELPLTDSGKLHKARLKESWRTAVIAEFDYPQLSGEPACTTH